MGTKNSELQTRSSGIFRIAGRSCNRAWPARFWPGRRAVEKSTNRPQKTRGDHERVDCFRKRPNLGRRGSGPGLR
jgi:hypothetical protein